MLVNDQRSQCLPVNACVSHDSILGRLYLFIYINDSSENSPSTVKLFADDTSVFSVVNDSNISANELNKELQEV